YERAIRASSGSCLVADAIKDQHPEFSSVKVDVATVRFTDKKQGVRYIYLTPASVAETLLAFDQGWTEDEKSLPRTIRIRTGLMVAPITRSASDLKAKAQHRAARITELEAKEQTGNELTGVEKRALSRLRNPKQTPERPTAYGSPKAEPLKGDEVILMGGKPNPTAKYNANLLHGHDRHFGAKTAQPSEVFKRAV